MCWYSDGINYTVLLLSLLYILICVALNTLAYCDIIYFCAFESRKNANVILHLWVVFVWSRSVSSSFTWTIFIIHILTLPPATRVFCTFHYMKDVRRERKFCVIKNVWENNNLKYNIYLGIKFCIHLSKLDFFLFHFLDSSFTLL